VVTKKQRRSQLARARAQRRSERLSAREARQRRRRLVAVVVVAVLAVGALGWWIATHDGEVSASAASSAGHVDYDALSAAPSTTPIEVTR
jgi:hypothetical protein